MADSPSYPGPYRDSDVGPDRGPTAGTPRWVKVFVIIALVLALLVGALLLTGGGEHGPGRHTGADDAGGQTQPSSDADSSGSAGGHTPPAGGHTR